jgi:hypothetical protein
MVHSRCVSMSAVAIITGVDIIIFVAVVISGFYVPAWPQQRVNRGQGGLLLLAMLLLLLLRSMGIEHTVGFVCMRRGWVCEAG